MQSHSFVPAARNWRAVRFASALFRNELASDVALPLKLPRRRVSQLVLSTHVLKLQTSYGHLQPQPHW